MLTDISTLWEVLLAIYEQKAALRAELVAVAESIDDCGELIDLLLGGVSLERLGTIIWLRLSWPNELFLASLTSGLFNVIISHYKTP